VRPVSIAATIFSPKPSGKARVDRERRAKMQYAVLSCEAFQDPELDWEERMRDRSWITTTGI
jgi:hypothetical protein